MSEIEPRGEQVTAQDVIRVVVETMGGMPITSRARGIIGKKAKELLADGFSPETVTTAAVIALRRSQPHLVDYIAQDIVLVAARQHLSPREYSNEVAAAKQRLDPDTMAMHERITRAMQKGAK